MARRLVITEPLKIGYEEAVVPAPGPGQVRLRTIVSAISHGTEMVAFLGAGPFGDCAFSAGAARVFEPKPADAPPHYPFRWAGYDLVGEVVEVGADVAGLAVGDRVFTATPHQTELLVDAARGDVLKLQPGTPSEHGIMLSLATVAFVGVHDAEIKLGDVVVVVGGGMVGQLATQLAFVSGARRVFLVEPNAARRRLAEAACPVETVDPADGIPGRLVWERNDRKHPDVVLECSGTVRGLDSALAAAGLAGTVVAVGFYARPATELVLGREFLHNRITLKASMGVWGCPSRWEHRWDRERQMKTVLWLIESGRLCFRDFISLRVPFAEAQRAYEAVRDEPQHLKIVLTYASL